MWNNVKNVRVGAPREIQKADLRTFLLINVHFYDCVFLSGCIYMLMGVFSVIQDSSVRDLDLSTTP